MGSATNEYLMALVAQFDDPVARLVMERYDAFATRLVNAELPACRAGFTIVWGLGGHQPGRVVRWSPAQNSIDRSDRVEARGCDVFSRTRVWCWLRVPPTLGRGTSASASPAHPPAPVDGAPPVPPEFKSNSTEPCRKPQLLRYCTYRYTNPSGARTSKEGTQAPEHPDAIHVNRTRDYPERPQPGEFRLPCDMQRGGSRCNQR